MKFYKQKMKEDRAGWLRPHLHISSLKWNHLCVRESISSLFSEWVWYRNIYFFVCIVCEFEEKEIVVLTIVHLAQTIFYFLWCYVLCQQLPRFCFLVCSFLIFLTVLTLFRACRFLADGFATFSRISLSNTQKFPPLTQNFPALFAVVISHVKENICHYLNNELFNKELLLSWSPIHQAVFPPPSEILSAMSTNS